jgi:hypothetical protein
VNFLRLLPVLVSFLVLGAHFLRAEYSPLAAVCLAIPFLLLLRRPWVPTLLQLVLVLGAMEWLRTLLGYVLARQSAGEPWIRLVVILGAVAVFTGCSALVFRLPALRKRYT